MSATSSVKRIGHHDVVITRIGGVDMIVADAERGYDLELGETRQRPGVTAHRIVGDRHAAYLGGDLRRQSLQIVGRFKMMQHELVGKAVVDDRLVRPMNQQIDFLGRDSSAHHQFSFPSALSCQRLSTKCEISASRP